MKRTQFGGVCFWFYWVDVFEMSDGLLPSSVKLYMICIARGDGFKECLLIFVSAKFGEVIRFDDISNWVETC